MVWGEEPYCTNAEVGYNCDPFTGHAKGCRYAKDKDSGQKDDTKPILVVKENAFGYRGYTMAYDKSGTTTSTTDAKVDGETWVVTVGASSERGDNTSTVEGVVRAKQTPVKSLIETSTQLILGFLVSMVVWNWIVGPWLGHDSNVREAAWITAVFTIFSFVRHYLVRRGFERWG